MFPVKHTVIYTFFAITSVQNTCFCSVFNALASKNPAKSCYVQCFFHFWPFFHCRKATKMTQKFHFNTLLRSDTQKSAKNVENTTVFWSRCETVFGPPQPKADIATAILTNVIEHLVLLFCPPISTPSPPKRCGRILKILLNVESSMFGVFGLAKVTILSRRNRKLVPTLVVLWTLFRADRTSHRLWESVLIALSAIPEDFSHVCPGDRTTWNCWKKHQKGTSCFTRSAGSFRRQNGDLAGSK